MKKIKYFYFVRDIPYKISTSLKEPDYSCSGKHEILFKLLKSLGLKVRYRICEFLWSSLNLPLKLQKTINEDKCTHTYLEINIKGKWKILDATWDIGLKKIFHINEWNGKSNTKIAVKPIKIFSPEKSKKMVGSETEELVRQDLKINREIYKGFNNWLENIRKKPINF